MILVVILLLAVTVDGYQNETLDYAGEQLVTFLKRTQGPTGILTTSYGVPVEYRDATQTLNRDLLFNNLFMEEITHLSREKIPERVVHGKGAGALGYFEVTHDITNICKAKFLNGTGKKTPITVRFSPVVTELGGSDTNRETRGFAIKFYTEEGNYDFVGLNVEMFLIKDPVFFTTFIHAFKRNPNTNLYDENARWDFLTQRPETLHTFLLLFGDRGIPDGHRFLPGFAIHTFEATNINGDKNFVKFHVLPEAGLKFLTSEEAKRIAGEDPDYATRDLYNAIASGNYPTWIFGIQVMTIEDVKTAGFDPFDVTLFWPRDKYPVLPVGKIVLNRNPDNHFAQVEQVAFNPGNLVPGIRGLDKTFEARTLSYRDAHYHRLGSNFNMIDINCPIVNTNTYLRDGLPYVRDNERDVPNYYPNSFNGPIPYLDPTNTDIPKVVTNPEVTNLGQAAQLYSVLMSEGERVRLVENIVHSLRNATGLLQERAVKLYYMIHPELGQRVAYSLKSAVGFQ